MLNNLIRRRNLYPSRIDLYIKEEELDRWHSLMTKNGLYGKGNVRIIITDEHVMHMRMKLEGLYVVSRPQLIIDLYDEGGVCEEAGELLMDKT